jgi:hypothetical protein
VEMEVDEGIGHRAGRAYPSPPRGQAAECGKRGFSKTNRRAVSS